METRKLFQPLQVRGMRLKNRMVLLPIGGAGYKDFADSPTERAVAMYRRQAFGGVGLLTVGIVYVEPYELAPTAVPMFGFYSDKQTPQYIVLTDAVHDAGAMTALQITHRWHSDFPYEMEDLTPAQVEGLIDIYVRAAVRAKVARFDAVEFEAAHGWPLQRFLSPLTNHRHDKYGEYAYVPCEIVRRSRLAVGSDFPLTVRLSIIEDIEGGQGITLEQSANELCPALVDAGADILSLSFGLGPVARKVKDYRHTETIYIEPGDKLTYFRAIKQHVRVPVIGRSRVNDPLLAERAVEENWVDLVGLGRQLLADPDFPVKVQERRYEDINRCIACNYCESPKTELLRYNRHCTVNPGLGREIEESPSPRVRRPKAVLVVGGGVAGMEAALRLAERDCPVTLVEQDDRLGGLLRQVAHLPHLRLLDLEYYVEYLERQLHRLPVTIRLNTTFSSKVASDAGAECLVLATGSTPPSGAAYAKNGAGVDVCTFLDYLGGRPIGERVVVDGGGEGAEFAVSLARGGHRVTLVEQMASLKTLPYAYGGPARLEALSDYLSAEAVGLCV